MKRYIYHVNNITPVKLPTQPTNLPLRPQLKESCRGNRTWVEETKETPGPPNVPQEDRYIHFDCRIHHTRDQTHVEAM